MHAYKHIYTNINHSPAYTYVRTRSYTCTHIGTRVNYRLHTHTHTQLYIQTHSLHSVDYMLMCHCVTQTDVVDDIPTVKFVYIQWVGNDVKPLSKAKISTHKGALEEMFYVSLYMCKMVTVLALVATIYSHLVMHTHTVEIFHNRHFGPFLAT